MPVRFRQPGLFPAPRVSDRAYPGGVIVVSVACVEVRVSQNYARAREVVCVARPSRLVRWASVSAVAALSMAAGAAFAQTTLPEVTVEAKKAGEEIHSAEESGHQRRRGSAQGRCASGRGDGDQPRQGIRRRAQRHRHQDGHAAQGDARIDLRGRRRADARPGRAEPAGSRALRAGRQRRQLRLRLAQRQRGDPRRAGGLLHRRPAHHVWASTPRPP